MIHNQGKNLLPSPRNVLSEPNVVLPSKNERKGYQYQLTPWGNPVLTPLLARDRKCFAPVPVIKRSDSANVTPEQISNERFFPALQMKRYALQLAQWMESLPRGRLSLQFSLHAGSENFVVYQEDNFKLMTLFTIVI